MNDANDEQKYFQRREELRREESRLLAELKKESVEYDYSFSVWPDETRDFDKAVYQLFEFLKGRIEMTFPEAGFERFRSALSHHGFTLRGITRVPHHRPEQVL